MGRGYRYERQAVVTMADRLGLIVLNRGNVTTCRRPEYRQTIVGVTLASEGVVRRIVDWRVLEDFTASDHQYISFMVQSQTRPRIKQPITKQTMFNSAKLNTDIFDMMISSGYSEMMRSGFDNRLAEDISLARMRVKLRACEESMPRKKTTDKYEPHTRGLRKSRN